MEFGVSGPPLRRRAPRGRRAGHIWPALPSPPVGARMSAVARSAIGRSFERATPPHRLNRENHMDASEAVFPLHIPGGEMQRGISQRFYVAAAAMQALVTGPEGSHDIERLVEK